MRERMSKNQRPYSNAEGEMTGEHTCEDEQKEKKKGRGGWRNGPVRETRINSWVLQLTKNHTEQVTTGKIPTFYTCCDKNEL